jgi:hypothetical protein
LAADFPSTFADNNFLAFGVDVGRERCVHGSFGLREKEYLARLIPARNKSTIFATLEPVGLEGVSPLNFSPQIDAKV